MDGVLVIIASICGVALTAILVAFFTTIQFRNVGLWRFLRRRSTVRLIVGVAALFAIVIVFFGVTEFVAPGATSLMLPSAEREGNLNALILVVSAVLASIGWLFTTYQQERNVAKDIAVRFVNQIVHDPAMERHKLNVSTLFPEGTKVEANSIRELKKEFRQGKSYIDNRVPVYYSIAQILNAYEQISTGVLEDHLDESVIKDFLGPRMKRAVTSKFRAVIVDIREANDFGERPSSFEAIVALMKRWYGIDLDN